MKTASMLLMAITMTMACGGEISRAVCNQCRGDSFTAEKCEQFAEAANCETVKLLTKTDDACNIGGEPRTYTACEFTSCSTVPDCRE
jgi:hypothetical protein